MLRGHRYTMLKVTLYCWLRNNFELKLVSSTLSQQDSLWALPLDQNQQTFFVDRIRALDRDTWTALFVSLLISLLILIVLFEFLKKLIIKKRFYSKKFKNSNVTIKTQQWNTQENKQRGLSIAV